MGNIRCKPHVKPNPSAVDAGAIAINKADPNPTGSQSQEPAFLAPPVVDSPAIVIATSTTEDTVPPSLLGDSSETRSSSPGELWAAKVLLLLRDLDTQHTVHPVEISETDRTLANENMTKIETLREVKQVKNDYAQAFKAAFATAITGTTSAAPQSRCASEQDPPRQAPRSATLQELFVQAEAAKQPFFRLLQSAEELVRAAHRQAEPLKLKEEDRSRDKIQNDYEGEACRLLDIVRGSIICRDFEEMDQIIQWLRSDSSTHDASLIRVKSGFVSEHAELTYGYRDVKLTVRVAGHLCELQLHLQSFYDIKNERGHKLYKWAREFAMAGINHPDQIMKQSPEAMACMEELLVERLLAKEPNFFVGWELEALKNILKLQGKFEPARAFGIVSVERSRALCPDSINLAAELNNLALLLSDLGQYEEARIFQEQALTIDRKVLGEEHPRLAGDLNNLALLLGNLGRYEEAIIFQEQALTIDRKVLGEEHPNVARDLNNLALLLKEQGKYDEAEPLYRQSLAIDRKVYGDEHPAVATDLNNLALLLSNLGQYEEARNFQEQALTIDRKVLGEEHPDVAGDLNNLASLLSKLGQYEEARIFQEQALTIIRRVLGDEHPNVAGALNNLASLLRNTGRETEAYQLGRQALGIATRVLGVDHPTTKQLRRNWPPASNVAA